MDEHEKRQDEGNLGAVPRTVGIILMGAGIAGILIPGPIGTPFFVLGGLIVFPSVFRGPDRWVRRRFPSARHGAMRLIDRYLEDVNRRFPSAGAHGSTSSDTKTEEENPDE